MTKHLSIWALVLSLGNLAHAAVATFTNIHHQYQSIRALGMGDAFTAVANDTSALFYNPAAYARFQEGEVNLALIDVEGSYNLPTLQSQAQGLFGTGTANVSNIVSTLNQMYGNQYGARVKALEVGWARPGWGMAFVPADVTTDFGVSNQAAPALDVRAYGDTTFGFAIGRTIRNQNAGLLSWGLTFKGIQREYLSTEVNAFDIATSSSASQAVTNSITTGGGTLSDGFTLDTDLGFLYTPYMPEWMWDWVREARPTFAIVGHNLVDEGFSNQYFKINPSNGTPEQLYRVFDFGTRFEIPQFWIFGGRFAIDERDYNHPQFNWKRGFHAGFEFDWTVTSWWKGQWRAGYQNGDGTAGFSALFTIFRLDLATYSEDVGTYLNPKPNREYELKMSMDI